MKIYNSLSRSVEEFIPQNKEAVTLYTCGPTVYNYPHIGNYRAYLFADILKRTLIYGGYTVKHIMNLTDIDDKTIRDSQKEEKSLKEFTEFYTEEFFKDRDLLNILLPVKYTKATDYVNEMVEIIEGLLEKGVAYKSEDGSVYFNIAKFPEYGKLAHLDLENLKTNAQGRVKNDEYDKENVQDFALWKAWDATDGDVFWETSLGKGRPGWHIECSAMSMKELGETIDIHTGGKDNMFPHHENEIAQSEAFTNKQFVKYWMHNEWLLVDGKKMAKSAGNFYTLRDVIEHGYNPLVFRYLTLSTHYRTPLNFTWESMKGAESGLLSLYQFFMLLGDVPNETQNISLEYKQKFIESLGNDLNTSAALAVVSSLRHDTSITPSTKKATLIDFDKVLGLGLVRLESMRDIPETIKVQVAEREIARKNKEWEKSDILRACIIDAGYTLFDTPEGSLVIPNTFLRAK